MTATKTRRIETDIIVSTSMAPPAVRMMLITVTAGHDPDGKIVTEHTLTPIIMLRTTAAMTFAKQTSELYSPVGITAKEMKDYGWTFDGHHVSTEALYVDAEGMIFPADSMSGCSNAVQLIVCCPWPAEMDEQQLAKDIADLRSQVIFKVEEIERRRKEKAA